MTDKQDVARRRETLDRVEKRARELEDIYHGCAQCSLLAIQQVCGLKNDQLSKAASGLSGGVGGMRSVCGALTGTALALGLKYGRDPNTLEGLGEEEAIEKSLAALEPVQKLSRWFEREFGSIVCQEIRKSHMGTELSRRVPWQKDWLVELGMHERCVDVVARTSRRAAAMRENPNLGILEEV